MAIRLDRQSLTLHLFVHIQAELRKRRSAILSKNTDTAEAAIDDVVASIIGYIDNGNRCVVQAGSLTQHHVSSSGAFGKDEVWPAPLLTDLMHRR